MVKLTAELIEQSAQYTNPVRDRELDLRGKYPNIYISICCRSRVLCRFLSVLTKTIHNGHF